MAEISPEALAAINRIDPPSWKAMFDRLLKFTSMRVKRLIWYGKRAGAMPSAKQIEDFVQEAITDVLSGERAWNPATELDLENHLRSIINSKINHLVNSTEHTSVLTDSALSGAPGSSAAEDDDGGPRAAFLANLPTPEIAVSDQLDADAFLTGLLGHLAGDAEAQQVVECIMDGVTKPREYAERLGKSKEDMYTITRRLRRKTEEFLKLWQKRERG